MWAGEQIESAGLSVVGEGLYPIISEGAGGGGYEKRGGGRTLGI